MPTLDVIAIVSIGLMVGCELCIALFVNPALRQIDPAPQGKALGLLAIALGRAMPVWYSASLLLLIAEGYVRRHDEHAYLIYVAAGILVAAIVASVTLLVPINNRTAQLASGASGVSVPDWQNQHAKWNSLHRARTIALMVMFACFVAAVVI